MKCFFITGTSTGVGKTHLGNALILAARKSGLRAIGYKPIESGCSTGGGPGEDALALSHSAGSDPQTTYALVAPIVPSRASSLAGIQISIPTIVEQATSLASQCDLLIIEGAGGLLTPISDNETIADLAIALATPLLIVAPNTLGSINLSLLTIEASKSRGLTISAVILSTTKSALGSANESHLESNLHNQAEIAHHGRIPVYPLEFSDSDPELELQGTQLLKQLFPNTKSRK